MPRSLHRWLVACGGRNITLNDPAWSLFRFAADGKVTPRGLADSLLSAAQANQQADYEAITASQNACGYRSLRT